MAERAGWSKSGLLRHFPTKEALQLAVVHRTAELFRGRVLLPSLSAPAGAPRLRTIFHHWLGWAQDPGLGGGCPLNAARLEFDDQPGEVRDALVASWNDWIAYLERQATKAIELKQITTPLTPRQLVLAMCGLAAAVDSMVRLLGQRDAGARLSAPSTALPQHRLTRHRVAGGASMFTHTLKATCRSLLFSSGRAGVRVGAVVTPRYTARHVARRFFTTERAAPERRRFTAEPPRTTTARLPDGQVVAYRWGDTVRAPTVMLVHGWNGWAQQLEPFVEQLRAQGYAVLAFDHVAHGASPGERRRCR